MTLFKNIKDGQLYIIYYVNISMYTGKWHTAIPYKHTGKPIDHCKMSDFIPVADSGEIPNYR
jgi:hypothetical protein